MFLLSDTFMSLKMFLQWIRENILSVILGTPAARIWIANVSISGFKACFCNFFTCYETG